MTRLLGAGMIIMGCLGMGLFYREQMRGRIRALRYLVEILERLAAELRYGRSTLPECCRSMADSMEEPFRACFAGIAEEMEEGNGLSFGELYLRNMSRCLKLLPLKDVDRDILLHLFSDEEIPDVGRQERCVLRYKDRLEKVVRELEAEWKEKSSLALGLGAMSGLLLVIVLI